MDENISIIYLINSDPVRGGGAEKRLLEEARYMASCGHQVTMLSAKTDPSLPARRYEENGLEIRTVKCVPDVLHRFSSLYFYLPRLLYPIFSMAYLFSIYHRDRPDIIVDNFSPFPSLAGLIFFPTSSRMVAIVHEFHDSTATEKYNRVFGSILLLVQKILKFGIYDSIIVTTDYTRSKLEEYGVKSEIIKVPIGIEKSEYQKLVQHSESGTLTNPLEMVVISRLVYRKGVDRILRAMVELKKEDIDVTLKILGEGPERTHLEDYVRKHGIENNVDFRGYATDEEKFRHLGDSDVFIFTSRQEGFGLVVLEAMSAGKPMILSDLPVFKEFVPEGGVDYVEGSDPEDIAESIRNLNELDKSKYKKMGQINQSRASNYIWANFLEELSKYYVKLVNGQTRGGQKIQDIDVDTNDPA